MALNSTGERFLPELRGAIRWEHLHRYLFARELVAGRDVVDVASGEGYGSRLLAERARHVVGIDIAEEAVSHARRVYAKEGVLNFIKGDCTRLPLGDASVDAVVSFETIEHVDNPSRALGEFHRVLRPGGVLVVSSPNRATYPKGNPFHRHEFSVEELRAELGRLFKHVALYGQRVVAGSCVLPLDGKQSTEVGFWDDRDAGQGFNPGMTAPIYIIAVASNAPLPATVAGCFDHADETRRLWHFFDQDYAEVCAELAAMKSSKSWQLTMPLRRFMRWASRRSANSSG